MKRKHKKSYDLFSSFSFYTPGWKGMIILTLLFLAGALIGNFAFSVVAPCAGQEFVGAYGVLIMYPCQFIPAMIYAAAKSHAAETIDGTGAVPLDDNRFQPTGGFLLAVIVAIGTICTAFIIEPITALLPEMPQNLIDSMKMLTGGPLWAALLSTAVMAPFFEEWLCRGLILRGFLQRVKPGWAIIISAAFFAIIHLNPWQAIPAFLLGCLFGLVYYKTGSLKLTMLMHCVNNATSVLLSRAVSDNEEIRYYWDLIPDRSTYVLLYCVCAAMVILLVTRLCTLGASCPAASASTCSEKSQSGNEMQ